VSDLKMHFRKKMHIIPPCVINNLRNRVEMLEIQGNKLLEIEWRCLKSNVISCESLSSQRCCRPLSKAISFAKIALIDSTWRAKETQILKI
jgi:hypothetical protein